MQTEALRRWGSDSMFNNICVRTDAPPQRFLGLLSTSLKYTGLPLVSITGKHDRLVLHLCSTWATLVSHSCAIKYTMRLMFGVHFIFEGQIVHAYAIQCFGRSRRLLHYAAHTCMQCCKRSIVKRLPRKHLTICLPYDVDET